MVLKRIEKADHRKLLIQGKLPKVLYVEDEDMNWNVSELHLRNKYDLKRARNSQEAFALLGRESFDLILLDIQLCASEYDGIDICKILKRRPGQYIPTSAKDLKCEGVPVVFVTAYSARYEKDELIKKAGADEVVTKPVDFNRLRLVSSRLIGQDALSKNPPMSGLPDPTI